MSVFRLSRIFLFKYPWTFSKVLCQICTFWQVLVKNGDILLGGPLLNPVQHVKRLLEQARATKWLFRKRMNHIEGWPYLRNKCAWCGQRVASRQVWLGHRKIEKMKDGDRNMAATAWTSSEEKVRRNHRQNDPRNMESAKFVGHVEVGRKWSPPCNL